MCLGRSADAHLGSDASGVVRLDEYSLQARREWIAAWEKMKTENRRLLQENNAMRSAVRELLVQNGGPTDTVEGADTHVLVRMKDFVTLERFITLEPPDS